MSELYVIMLLFPDVITQKYLKISIRTCLSHFTIIILIAKDGYSKMCINKTRTTVWEIFFLLIWVNQPFKNPAYSHHHHLSLMPPFLSLSPPFPRPPSSLLTHLSISPPSTWPPALTSSGRSAAAVTGGQEVKAKVECHTHRVTVMPGCCVSPWMEGSECQTRWRAPDALTLASACPFPSRGQRRGPVLAAPPIPAGHHRYCCNSCY